jgi:hypothetical protein
VILLFFIIHARISNANNIDYNARTIFTYKYEINEDVCVRGLLIGLFGSSASSGLFPDFVFLSIAFLTCTRRVFVSTAFCLRFAVFAVFCARWVFRTACFSVFSRVNRSRAIYRVKSRGIFFFLASRVFLFLKITVYNFLSVLVCCYCSCAYFSSAIRWRTRPIFAGLKKRV